jgi:hypothetical protein
MGHFIPKVALHDTLDWEKVGKCGLKTENTWGNVDIFPG